MLTRILEKLDKTTLAFFAVLLFIAYFAFNFAAHTTIGTFADDSVSYIIMGQSYSPYFSTSPVIQGAAKLENYPPVFPLFLALTGASHNYLLGHVLVVCLLLSSLVALYFFSATTLKNNTSVTHKNKVAALLVALLFAASPSTWLNVMGILSENLYIFLVLSTLYYYESKINDKEFLHNTAIIFGVLLGLVLLTRTIGISLIAALIITTVIKERSLGTFFKSNWLITLLIPATAASLWYIFGTNRETDLYANDVSGVIANVFTQGSFWSNLSALVQPQLEGLTMSWYTAFLLHWRSEFEMRAIIVAIFAFFILAGLIARLLKNKIDAWYTLFYLMIVVVWPYSEQTGRFLYPALPLLFLYGAVGLGLIQNKLPQSWLKVHFIHIVLLLIIATVIPTMAFFQSRAQYETELKDMDFTRVMLFYNYPNLADAERIALHHEHLRQDLEKIKQSTEDQASIMWYTPNYINLLSERKAVRFPRDFKAPNFFEQVKQSGADYIFAAKLNPRYTSADFDGLAIYSLFTDISSLVWSRQNPMGIGVLSVLLKIDQEKLDIKIRQQRNQ